MIKTYKPKPSPRYEREFSAVKYSEQPMSAELRREMYELISRNRDRLWHDPAPELEEVQFSVSGEYVLLIRCRRHYQDGYPDNEMITVSPGEYLTIDEMDNLDVYSAYTIEQNYQEVQK
jgi:hypothetical protein